MVNLLFYSEIWGEFRLNKAVAEELEIGAYVIVVVCVSD
jgi:hypothetical protein